MKITATFTLENGTNPGHLGVRTKVIMDALQSLALQENIGNYDIEAEDESQEININVHHSTMK